jgi:hypothetical protein
MLQDGVPINTLERAVSDDVVIMQELLARQIAEMARVLTLQNYKQLGSGTQITRSNVSSGLMCGTNGTQIYMHPGILAQLITSYSPPSVPAPGSNDSSYRFGVKYELEYIADPWDVSSAWWLLEARVIQETTLSENRDIYNPTLGTFAPSGPFAKQYENSIEWKWNKGTPTTIAARTAGWAPIMAVYRDIAGGVIASTDIINLSIQFEDLDYCYSGGTPPMTRRDSMRFRMVSDGIGGGGDYSAVNLSGAINGMKCFAYQKQSGSTTSFRNVDFIDPGDVGVLATADIWWYLYIVPVYDEKCPQGMYGFLYHRGIVVCSRVPPNDEGSNSASIDLPPPIGGSASEGEGLFLAVWRSDGVLNDIHYIDIASNGEGKVNRWEFENNNFLMNVGNSYHAGAHNLATTGPGGLEDVPYGCHLKCFVESSNLDNVSVAESIEVVWGLPLDSIVFLDYPRCLLSCRNHMHRLFELTPKGGALTLTLTTEAKTAALAASGGGIGDGGGNAYRAGIWGIRLI